MTLTSEVTVPPRDGGTFEVSAGSFFRIVSVDGAQVGDLNLWNSQDLGERFFSGKTRQLHATHVSTGRPLVEHVARIAAAGDNNSRHARLVRLGR